MDELEPVVETWNPCALNLLFEAAADAAAPPLAPAAMAEETLGGGEADAGEPALAGEMVTYDPKQLAADSIMPGCAQKDVKTWEPKAHRPTHKASHSCYGMPSAPSR